MFNYWRLVPSYNGDTKLFVLFACLWGWVVVFQLLVIYNAYYTRSLFVMFIPLFAASFYTSASDRRTSCSSDVSTEEEKTLRWCFWLPTSPLATPKPKFHSKVGSVLFFLIRQKRTATSRADGWLVAPSGCRSWGKRWMCRIWLTVELHSMGLGYIYPHEKLTFLMVVYIPYMGPMGLGSNR